MPQNNLDEAIYHCHYTDAGNADALALLFGGRLRSVHGLKWHVWNGNYWKPDTDGYAIQLVRQLALKRQAVIRDHSNVMTKEMKENLASACGLENSVKAASCLKMAEGASTFSTSLDAINNYPMLLACPNGTVDLEVGKLYPADSSRMITNCTGVNFNPDAKSPLWKTFLEDIFITKIHTPDYQFIRWLQKVLGYTLTDNIGERSMYICFGEGANGKSTMLSIINHVLGSYAAAAPFAHFLESKNESTNDIARLKGKRFVTASESGPGKFMDEVKIKQLTGGDNVTCRFLYNEFFTYRPTYKIFLSCNDKPRLKGTDNAIWDRMKILPFNVRFKDDERDLKLYEKLVGEAEGILNWMVDGCTRWQIEGLEDCLTVKEYTNLYRTEEDALERFLKDKTKKRMGAFTTCEELWRAYNNWAKMNGENLIVSTLSLGHKMSQKGHVAKKSGNVSGYKDLEV
jgi:putative DNA primase/helicase